MYARRRDEIARSAGSLRNAAGTFEYDATDDDGDGESYEISTVVPTVPVRDLCLCIVAIKR